MTAATAAACRVLLRGAEPATAAPHKLASIIRRWLGAGHAYIGDMADASRRYHAERRVWCPLITVLCCAYCEVIALR